MFGSRRKRPNDRLPTNSARCLPIHHEGGIRRQSRAYAILRALGFGPEDAERRIRTGRPVAELRRCYVKDAEAALKRLGYT